MGREELVFSQDGSRFARTGTDAGVHVWNIGGGGPTFSLRAESLSGAFAPSGQQFAIGSSDKEAAASLWNLP